MNYSTTISQRLLYELSAARRLSTVVSPLWSLARKLSHQVPSIDTIVGHEPVQSYEPMLEAHPDFGVNEYPLVSDPYQQGEAFAQPLELNPTPAFVAIEPIRPGLDSIAAAHPLTATEEISAAIDEVRGLDTTTPEPLAPASGVEQLLQEPFGDLFPPLFDMPM